VIQGFRRFAIVSATAIALAVPGAAQAPQQVRITAGMLEGIATPDHQIRIFEGIPFAAPPVGNLRWQPPQPVAPWSGVRQATAFGARCMQGNLFPDMVFRDTGPSEDCLYLNVWTPAKSAGAHLPVMVWIYGGGFQAGSASEPRQDGEALARKGVIVVNMNYRLGVFGFFAHPELTKESPHHAAGNYGLLDQAAALRWVHDNIAAFGGDPAKVTIFGESAGSISVSEQMASPLSRGLFQRAIGESGGIADWTSHKQTLAHSEQVGATFAQSLGALSLADLRAKPAAEILQSALDAKGLQFWPNIDGYFFPEDPMETYAAGRQARVPLLAGWNADEHRANQFFGNKPPTRENYLAKVDAEFGPDAPAILKLFPGETDAQINTSAHDLASAEFITYSTWKWLELQVKAGSAPVYRYHFEQSLPQEPGKQDRGVHHGADIQFVFETLGSQNLPWTADHRMISDMMSSYWTNFAKTGNPNGPGLPQWPRYRPEGNYAVMHLRVGQFAQPQASPAGDRAQYELLDQIANEHRPRRRSPTPSR
jgi:para-nitrobenzyl esterase